MTALIVGPRKTPANASRNTFNGDVTALVTYPGRNPHVPVFKRVLT